MKEVKNKNKNEFKERDEIDTYFSDAKKKSFPTGIIFFILFLLLVGGIVYYYFVIDSPKNIFLNALNNTTKNIQIDYTEYKTSNIDYKLDLNITTNNKEYMEIVDILDNISITGTSETNFEEKINYTKMNTFYQGNDLLTYEGYFKDNTMYLKMDDIFDKVVKYNVEKENQEELDKLYEASDMENTKKTIDSLKDVILNTLKNANYTKEYTKLNNQYVKKITLSIDKELMEYFYNQLLDNNDFLEGYSKLTEVTKSELKEQLEEEKSNLEDETEYLSLYLSILDNKFIMLESIYDEERATITYENDEYNYKLYEDSIIMYQGSISIKKENDEYQVKFSLDDIEEQIVIDIDCTWSITHDKEISSFNIENAIDYESLTENDLNKMIENISKNDTLITLVEDIMVLFTEETTTEPTQTT